MKIIVYTCITDGYDRLTAVTQETGVEFICFTERGRRLPKHWVRRDFAPQTLGMDSHQINRYHKFFSHMLFPENQFSIYQDGNLSFSGSYSSTIKSFRQSEAALAAFLHPENRTIEDEAKACIDCGKFRSHDLEKYRGQLEFYSSAGYALDRKISANYFLVRDHHHPEMSRAMEGVWSDLRRFTRRDQLSLGYNLWCSGVPFSFLEDLGISESLITRKAHKHEFIKVRLPNYVKRVSSRWFGS